MTSARDARRAWRALEPLHGMIYFATEAAEGYRRLGIDNQRMGYFASRSAAMGPVSADVVIATFYNFNPDVVRRVIPDAWRIAEPTRIVEARLDGAERALRRALGDAVDSREMVEAAGLARRAAEAACEHPQGRPLFAAHADLPWPLEPHLGLWHAQTLLREFRGDGHVSTLLTEEVSGIEALVVHGASGEVPLDVLQQSRGWPDGAWAAAIDRLRGRGWLTDDDPPMLTDAGREHRKLVERRTDALSLPAYRVLDDEEINRLRELGKGFSRQVMDAGLLPGGAATRRVFEDS